MRIRDWSSDVCSSDLFYAYIGWTFLLSFTNSRFMPSYKWAGLQQYERLWDNARWMVASQHLLVFGRMFIAISLLIGVVLAVLLAQSSAERRVGEECVCTCNFGWTPYREKNTSH